MAILRQAHRKQWTQISNKLAQNNKLSLRARGLMVYLLSLPDDWKVHLNHLIKVLKEGRRVIESTIRELKDAGFIHHQKMGFKQGWEYFVFEEETSEEEFKKFLRTLPVCEFFRNANSCQDVHIQRTKETSTKKEPLHKARKGEEDPSVEKKKPRQRALDKVLADWKAEGRPESVIQRTLDVYNAQPKGSIGNIAAWLETVYDQKLESQDIDELVEYRKRFVEKNSYKFILEKNTVTYISGSFEKKYRLNGDEEFWAEHGLSLERYLQYKQFKQEGMNATSCV